MLQVIKVLFVELVGLLGINWRVISFIVLLKLQALLLIIILLKLLVGDTFGVDLIVGERVIVARNLIISHVDVFESWLKVFFSVFSVLLIRILIELCVLVMLGLVLLINWSNFLINLSNPAISFESWQVLVFHWLVLLQELVQKLQPWLTWGFFAVHYLFIGGVAIYCNGYVWWMILVVLSQGLVGLFVYYVLRMLVLLESEWSDLADGCHLTHWLEVL